MSAFEGIGFRRQVVTARGASNIGVTVTAAATANVKGSYATLLTTGQVDFDIAGFYLFESNSNAANALSNMVADIGLGPDASNVSILVPDLLMGYVASDWMEVYGPFHMFIPSGSGVFCRIAAETVSDVTQVGIWAFGEPCNGWLTPRTFSQVAGVGVDTTGNSKGTPITPGASNAEGSYVTLGTAPWDAEGFLLVVKGDDSNQTAQDVRVDVALGSSSETLVLENVYVRNQGAEANSVGNPSFNFLACPIASGETIRVRMSSSAAAPDVFAAAVYLYR